MADFKRQGGTLTGREERYDGFEGEPRAVGSSLGGSTTGTTGTTGTGLTGSHHNHNTGVGRHHDSTTDVGRHHDSTTDVGRHHDSTTGTTGTYDDNTTTGKKPSLLDRLNPMKDSDHDGKRGIGE